MFVIIIMKDYFFILPNQLFENNLFLEKYTNVILYEHPLYFSIYEYHKMKLILHRSTMKYYSHYVKNKYNASCHYYEFNYDIGDIFVNLKNDNVHIYDPIDYDVMNELKICSKKYGFNLFIHESPNFMCKSEDLQEYVKEKNIFVHSSFYIWFRKKFNILLTDTGKPLHGKWSFDKENRLPFSNDFSTDVVMKPNDNNYVKEAIKYVEKHFPNNFGKAWLYLPTDFASTKLHFKTFLKKRLNCFGPYEDSVREDIVVGCHSLLSALINIGFINPDFIVQQTLKYFIKYKVEIQSVEGFIRQLFWREYVRFIYIYKHSCLVKGNYFNHTNKLGVEWFDASTNIPPVDNMINKLNKYGYLHHIERLMYIGNFMLLSKIDPSEVFRWFMLFIDAYPWVMEPNVYGMSQYCCGPIMTKKPYFSSSNYLNKMSSYKKNDLYDPIVLDEEEYHWYEIWDALYYSFIHDNYDMLKKNYSTAISANLWKSKSVKEKNKILKISRLFY